MLEMQVSAAAAAAAAEEARRLRGEKRVLFDLEPMGLGSVCYHTPRGSNAVLIRNINLRLVFIIVC